MKRSLYVFFVMIWLSAISVSAGEMITGTISGKIMIRDGGPMADGVVLFFNDATGPPPDIDKYMRVPLEITNTDGMGRFTADLPEGRYYIGGLKHIMGIEGAPLNEGDLIFISSDATGSPNAYSVAEGEHLDVGVLSGAVSYTVATVVEGITTAIEGTIHDMSGNPVENTAVFAHVTSSIDGGLSFLSDWTDTDGRYLLRVHQGGRYYLRVEGIQGLPLNISGVVIGDNKIKGSEGVTVETGKIKKGVDIIVIFPPDRRMDGE